MFCQYKCRVLYKNFFIRYHVFMNNLIAIGNLIKLKREEKSWTQEQLANKLEISPVTVSAYEKGIRKPTLKRAKQLSEILGIDLSELLDIKLDISEHSLNLALRAEGIVEKRDLEEIKKYIDYLKFKKKNEK